MRSARGLPLGRPTCISRALAIEHQAEPLRAGLERSAPSSIRYVVPAAPLGIRPGVDLDRALALAAELEDREIIQKLARRK